jgi:predicted dehydrogenase
MKPASKGKKVQEKKSQEKMIRYAVVGLGYFAQTAVLPAFAHARKNSRLTGLVSGDPVKLREMARQYKVPHTWSYEEYEAALDSGEIDAVYIVLPNDMHKEYTIRAARKGIHVLCEKPMAVTERECEAMMAATDAAGVQLMVAYRLHLEEANLKAVEIARSGKIGIPRIFNSVFSMQVLPGNIRLDAEKGGGPLYDIGVYCLNAARYLFQAEPEEVVAFSATRTDKRFRDVNEMVSAILRFPEDRLASFTCSFGAADARDYQIIGTEGSLRVEEAYTYAGAATHVLTRDGKKKTTSFKRKDQIAAEIQYFSEKVRQGKRPEPDGREGLADIRIVRALLKSLRSGKPVKLTRFTRTRRPRLSQKVTRPPVRKKPKLVRAKPVSPG